MIHLNRYSIYSFLVLVLINSFPVLYKQCYTAFMHNPLLLYFTVFHLIQTETKVINTKPKNQFNNSTISFSLNPVKSCYFIVFYLL